MTYPRGWAVTFLCPEALLWSMGDLEMDDGGSPARGQVFAEKPKKQRAQALWHRDLQASQEGSGDPLWVVDML